MSTFFSAGSISVALYQCGLHPCGLYQIAPKVLKHRRAAGWQRRKPPSCNRSDERMENPRWGL